MVSRGKKIVSYVLATIMGTVFFSCFGLIVVGEFMESSRDSSSHWAIVNPQGQLVGAGRYQALGEFSAGLAPAQGDEDLWGFVDREGAWAIAPTFAEARAFSDNGLAAVQLLDGRRWGYVGTAGRMRIEARFELAYDFSGGVAVVGRTCGMSTTRISGSMSNAIHCFGLVDESGTSLIAPAEHDDDEGALRDIGPMAQALAPANNGDRWGYIDRAGRWVIEASFDHAKSFAGGRGAVEVNGRWGYVDTSGRMIIEPAFAMGFEFSEGRAEVHGGSARYIDLAGEAAFTLTAEEAGPFAEGRAAVRIGDAFGYIDAAGRSVIEPAYVDAKDFSEGLAFVAVPSGEDATLQFFERRWGVIDASGAVVVSPRFLEVGDGFRDGRAAVRVDLAD